MGNHAITAATSSAGRTDTASPASATHWWQWVLLYPTLAIAVMSAAPTWFEKYQAMRVGVSRQHLALAEEQNRLWETNFDCATAQEIQVIRNRRNVEVGAQVCPSGDVLIRIKLPDAERPKIRWVSARSLEQPTLLGRILGPSTAFAAPGNPNASPTVQSVLRQRWLRPGVLKQRVRQGTGCVDLVINTYTGNVVTQTSVNCGAAF